MNLLEAKNAIQTIAHETKSVHADESMPMSEKKAFFDKAEIDLKNASDIVSIDAQAKRLMQGGETSEAETSAPVTLQRKSLGQLVVESAAYKSAFANGAKSQFSSSVDLKTVGTINEGATLSGGFGTGLFGAAVVPEYLPGIVDLRFNPLVVSDLFAQGTTSSSSISYLKESVFQNNAAGVAEGAAIPQTDDAAVRVQVQVGKIAHLLKITDEMLMDAEAPRIRSATCRADSTYVWRRLSICQRAARCIWSRNSIRCKWRNWCDRHRRHLQHADNNSHNCMARA